MSSGPLPDDALLDDPAGLEAADPDGMLRAYASAGAQVRRASRAAAEGGVPLLGVDGRPRALVVCGAGTAALAGSVLAAVVGPACPVPVVDVRDPALPGWVGPLDVVIASSASGRSEEALALAEEAARRGARLVTVTTTGSPLHRLGEQTRAAHVAVETGGQPARATLWALTVPLLAVADVLGLVPLPGRELAAAADLLDARALAMAPTVPVGENPAKDLALALAGSMPMVWSTSPVTASVAERLVGQLAAAVGVLSLPGRLPDAAYAQIGVLDGALVDPSGDDIFLDPFESPVGPRVRLVLVRDRVEHPTTASRAAAAAAVADTRSVPVTVLRAEAETPLLRVAELVSLVDFAVTYLALATGRDPASSPAVDELAGRTGQETT